MFFTPVIRRAAYTHTPRSADLALQRFLMGTLGATLVVLASQRATPLPRMTSTPRCNWMCPVCHASN